MKKFIITSILAVLTAAMTMIKAQDRPDEYLGLPGDNLNLYAVMKLFQESETIEGFERSLNDENSRINNLDLNGDNYIDYITVSDYVDGDVHTIVLRAALNKNDYQDLAVFTVQRFRNGSVQIQLIGDETLYGRNYIIEPIYDDNYAETPNPGYIGRPATRANVTVVRTTAYEVAAWPLVRFIYLPGYSVWRSSWHWGYYPAYWNPWRPYYYHYYYGYHHNWYNHYYRHYRHSDHYRYARYNDFYYGRIRTYSPTVVVNINRGNYKATYSRPDQRRDGEALYTKTYASQNSRTMNNAANNSQERRAATQSSRERSTEVTGTGTARRAGTSANTRTGTNASSGQSNATSRRSPAAVSSEKAASRPAAAQNSTTARRTTSAVSGRNDSRPESVQNKPATRSSGTAVSDRTRTTSAQSTPAARRSPAAVSKSQPVKRSEPAKSTTRTTTSRQQASSASSSSSRRSSSSSKSSSGTTKSNSRKESESSSSRRR